MAEPIEMPFRLWTRVGPRKHVLGGVHTVVTWRTPLNCPHAAEMRPFCQITLATCYKGLRLQRHYHKKTLHGHCTKPRIERVQALSDISRSVLRYHSNKTCAPTANLPNSAQLEGTPTILPTYIRVCEVVWECCEGQTDTHTQP